MSLLLLRLPRIRFGVSSCHQSVEFWRYALSALRNVVLTMLLVEPHRVLRVSFIQPHGLGCCLIHVDALDGHHLRLRHALAMVRHGLGRVHIVARVRVEFRWRRHHSLQFVLHLVPLVLLNLKRAYLIHLAVQIILKVVLGLRIMLLPLGLALLVLKESCHLGIP